MKKHIFLTLCAMLISGCMLWDVGELYERSRPDEYNRPVNQTPVADDFIINNLSQFVRNIKPVTITPKIEKSTGNITIYYNNATTLPENTGIYKITFDVAAAKGWNAVSGLYGGDLVIYLFEGVFIQIPEINIYYTSTLKLANISLPSGYEWLNPDTSLNVGDRQVFPVTYLDPSGDYSIAYGEVIVNVRPEDDNFPPHPSIDIIYMPNLTLADITLLPNYFWDDSSTVLHAGEDKYFTAIYIDPIGNIPPAHGNITLNVAKANGAVITALTIESLTHNNIIVSAVDAPNNGQIVQYARSLTNAEPVTGWQTNLIFSGLSPNTIYYIFARTAENNNYRAGTSISIMVTTPIEESFTITFENFTDINTPITAGTIYIIGGTGRPVSTTITVGSPQRYDTGSIKWYLNNNLLTAGVSGIYGESFTVNSYAPEFNNIGQYTLTVEMKIDGKLYSKIITFEVRP